MISHWSHWQNASIGLAVALVAVTAFPAVGQTIWSADYAGPIDAAFEDLDMSGPGCALGVVADGRLAYAKGYGQANMDFGLPITPTSNFYLGSVSKQFTAAAVAHAARAGHLSLDDDIRKWVSEIPEYDRTITIRNLIHHTSGIRDFLGLWGMAGIRPDDVNTEEDALAIISRQSKTNFPAGDRFLYSNSGYFVLGVIIERATGMSLREYTQEHFLGPLGMSRSRFNDTRAAIMSERVTGYGEEGEAYRMDHAWNWEIVGPGGMYSNIEDLYHWDRNFYSQEVGGEGFTDQLLERGILTDGQSIPYAFGLTHGTYRGLATVSHGGALAGFRTHVLRFPELRTTVLVLCNIPSGQPSVRASAVADIVLADHLDSMDEEDGEEAPDRTPVQLTTAQLDAFTGSWTASIGVVVDILREDDRLVFVQSGRRVPITPTAENVLWMAAANIEMTFTETRDGRFVAMDVVQNGRPFTATWNDPTDEEEAVPEHSELVGEYYSEDLDATYSITLTDGVPTLTISPTQGALMVSSEDDVFTVGPWQLVIDRQAGGIMGFTIDAGRVLGVYFSKTDRVN